MTKRRWLVVVTATITVLRYALIAETALQVATGADVSLRASIIALMTVSLWFLNGAGVVALLTWIRHRRLGAV